MSFTFLSALLQVNPINQNFVRIFTSGAVLLALATVYALCLADHAGPYRDMWVAMDFIRAWFEGDGSWPDLFALHGGAHRLLVPRLLFLVEYGIFSGTNLFLFLVSLLTQLSVVGLVWYWLKTQTELSGQERIFLVAVSLGLMINPTQLENFLYTFDVQWFLTAAAALWAITFWLRWFESMRPPQRVCWRDLVCAGLATGLSMFSSFSGVCLLLILPVMAWIYRVKPLWMVGLLLACGMAVFAYLQGPFSDASDWIGIKEELTVWRVVLFVYLLLSLWIKWTILYLGSPLSREFFWPSAALVMGSGSFLLWQLYCVLREGVAARSAFYLFALFAALFALVVALATGWGRMHFINTANEDRYQSIVLVYWLGIFLLAYQHTRLKPVSRKITLGVICVWMGGVIPYASLKDMRAQINFFDRVNTANLALATGQWEFRAIRPTLILGDQAKHINRPQQHGDFLRQRQWGIFAGEQALLLGRVLGAAEAGVCTGQLLAVTPIGEPYGGYVLSGQAYDAPGQRLIERLLLLDGQQRVVGLARLQRHKDSLLPLAWQDREQAQWTGYTVALPAPTSLHVWGERQDGSYCVITSAKLPMAIP